VNVSATGTAVNMQTLATGMTRERLLELSWEQVDKTDGLFRMALILDLDRNDIRPEVRLNAAVLKRFRPQATSIRPQGLGDFHEELTPEWRPVRARFANALVAAMREDVNLGARGMTTEALDEYGNVKAPPRAHRGFPGLIEIRMPAEAALVVAKS
jgi:hypothetical protein